MLGTLLGLIWAATYVANSAANALGNLSVGAIALSGVVLALLAVLVGQLFRKTIGIALMFAMVGAAIAAIIEWVHGNAGLGFALLLHAALFWAAQQVLAINLRRPRGSLRYSQRASVASLPSRAPRRDPVLDDVARFRAVQQSLAMNPSRAPRRDPEEVERERQAYVRQRAAAGVPSALSILWNEEGEPLRDPDTLVEGDVYGISYDLGVYRGWFHGRRLEGFPNIDDYPEVANWYAFEPADSGEESAGRAGVRFKLEDFTGDRAVVVSLPVPQDQARRVFEAKRAAYRKWDAERSRN